LLIDSLLTPIVESTYLNRDMWKFESSQKDESTWQSTDSSKAYRNSSAFKYNHNKWWWRREPSHHNRGSSHTDIGWRLPGLIAKIMVDYD